jgi:Divergent InlB B-repeat domain
VLETEILRDDLRHVAGPAAVAAPGPVRRRRDDADAESQERRQADHERTADLDSSAEVHDPIIDPKLPVYSGRVALPAPSHTLGLAVLLGGLGVLGLVVASSIHPAPAPGPAPGPQGCGPGQVAIDLITQGGHGSICGCGTCTRGQARVCPAFGEACTFTAIPDFGASFQNWQGPGGFTSSQNPIFPVATDPGFIAAVFNPPPWAAF